MICEGSGAASASAICVLDEEASGYTIANQTQATASLEFGMIFTSQCERSA